MCRLGNRLLQRQLATSYPGRVQHALGKLVAHGGEDVVVVRLFDRRQPQLDRFAQRFGGAKEPRGPLGLLPGAGNACESFERRWHDILRPAL